MIMMLRIANDSEIVANSEQYEVQKGRVENPTRPTVELVRIADKFGFEVRPPRFDSAIVESGSNVEKYSISYFIIQRTQGNGPEKPIELEIARG